MEDSVSGGLIDIGNYTFGKDLFTESEVDFFTVVANDLTNGKFPVRFSFQVAPRSKVAKGAYLVVTMPVEVKPLNVRLMLDNCL